MNVKELIARESGLRLKASSSLPILPLNLLTSQEHTIDDADSFNNIYSSKFNPYMTNHLAIGCENGSVFIQEIDQKPGKTHRDLISHLCHPNAIYDLAWAPYEPNRFITVSGDHTATLWNLSSFFKEVMVFRSHTRSIKSVDYTPSNSNVFATGGRDNIICLWDQRYSNASTRPLTQITQCHCITYFNLKNCQDSQYSSVTGLKFLNDNYLLSCGAGDGYIKMWDMRKYYNIFKTKNVPFQMYHHPKKSKNGFSNLTVDSMGTKIYASCIDSHIYSFNIAQDDSLPTHSFFGHESANFFTKISLSPDDQFLLAGSSSENNFIWNTDKPGLPVIKLPSDTDVINNCVDWSKHHSPTIITASYNHGYRIWKVDPTENGTCKAVPYPKPIYRSPNLNNINTKPKSSLLIKKTTKLGHSPTLNLPNMVEDGEPIRHICTSNQNRFTAKNNWLIQLQRRNQQSQRNRVDKSTLRKLLVSKEPAASILRYLKDLENNIIEKLENNDLFLSLMLFYVLLYLCLKNLYYCGYFMLHDKKP